MHRIIEQAAVLCGMVKSQIHPATEETAAHGEYHHRTPSTQRPHHRDEARSEAQPQAEDAHRAARLRRTLAHRDRWRALLLAHHRVYGRIPLRRGRARRLRRAPAARPETVLGQEANERVEKLLEVDSPIEHGWLRSRWSCKLLAVQLLRERLALREPGDRRRALHGLGFRWRRPRPIPPEKDSEEQIKRSTRGSRMSCK